MPKPHTTEVEDGEVDDAKTSNTANNPNIASTIEPDKKPEVAASVPEPQISEVLLKRQQHLRDRDNLAKSAAASSLQSTQALAPQRVDPSRNHAIVGLADRNNNHLLPSRPDAPFPSHHDARNPRHGDRRDGRDARLSDLNRPGRPGERSVERPVERMGGDLPRAGPGDRPGDRIDNRPRDFPGSDRRNLDPNTKDFGRPSDRNLGLDRVRDPPPRWTADSARDTPDRFRNGAQSHDSSGRLSRETAMPPPRSLPPPSDRAPPIASERGAPLNPERQELINSERQALISGGSPRGESPRRGREDFKDRNSSRPQSPRRHGLEMEMAEARRDDRPSRDDRSNRNGPEEHLHTSRSRPDDSHAPPAGPRSDRQMDRSVERGPNDRMPFQPMPVPPRQSLPDPNFGRLNPVPSVPDIPSGPRDRNSRGNRPALPPSVAPSRRDIRPETQRPPTPEKQPPTGPSQGRQPRRPGQIDVTSASISGPVSNSSANTSPAIGVHPDRLKHLPVQAVTPAPPPPPPPTPANVPVVAGMHPDRRMAYGNDAPINHQGNNRPRQPLPPQVPNGPPIGPKANQGSPLGAMASSMSAPTGPAFSNERTQRNGPRRQLAGINTTLQQGGSGSINVRGRGGRVSGSGSGRLDSPSQSQSHFAIPPPPPGPPQHNVQPEPVREVQDLIDPARADLITANPSNNDNRDRDPRSRRSDHSGRRSRKSSRSPGRERDSKRPKLDDERASREHKDRRGSERIEPDRERNPSRSSPHPDLIPGRESRGSTREGRERERSERDPGRSRESRDREARDPQHENWNTSEHRPERGERGPERGGGGRSRDMGRVGDPRNEERRDSRSNRGGEDGGRKRHSEDAAGLETRGREKRPRNR